MREREWRKQFIAGKTPEQAAQYATTYICNNTVSRERRR